MSGFRTFAQCQCTQFVCHALLANGNGLNAGCRRTVARVSRAADGNCARSACHSILTCGKGLGRRGIGRHAKRDGRRACGLGAVTNGNRIARIGISTLANRHVVIGGNGCIAAARAVGIRAQGDVVLALDAFGCACADTNHVIHGNGVAYVSYRAFADTDIAVVIGVSGVQACLFADKHIGAAGGVGVPAQCRGILPRGFRAVA